MSDTKGQVREVSSSRQEDDDPTLINVAEPLVSNGLPMLRSYLRDVQHSRGRRPDERASPPGDGQGVRLVQHREERPHRPPREIRVFESGTERLQAVRPPQGHR
ncbi:hypothetical protein TNIN_282561 [Trichonephila inaurata madagascariensis]|uniref:Uncharacterized protein n=1 Tax=Trichonephila inaurata madagascariensis TaxID=2747483 RepID=A0A8X6YEE5_9ARAC|nr:hypothetical protein TNIN_282561 [Trichonephila inaurata madagascariensis]